MKYTLGHMLFIVAPQIKLFRDCGCFPKCLSQILAATKIGIPVVRSTSEDCEVIQVNNSWWKPLPALAKWWQSGLPRNLPAMLFFSWSPAVMLETPVLV